MGGTDRWPCAPAPVPPLVPLPFELSSARAGKELARLIFAGNRQQVLAMHWLSPIMPPEAKFIEGVVGVIVGFAYYWNDTLSRGACEDTWWGKLLKNLAGQHRAPLVLKYGLSAFLVFFGAWEVHHYRFW